MAGRESDAYTASPSPRQIVAAFQWAESSTRTSWGPGAKSTHRMDVQWVHSEVVRVHVQAVEHLPQGNLPAPLLGHCPVGLRLVRVLDEAQQVLLVHAGSCMDVRVHLRHSAPAGEPIHLSQHQEPGPLGLGVECRALAAPLVLDCPTSSLLELVSPPPNLAAQSPSWQHQETFSKFSSDLAIGPVNTSVLPNISR